jgi:hypothetical protein
MELLQKDQLRTLVDGSAGPCVSIFLPTHRWGVETKQDCIRLKNQLRAAEKQLAARGLRSTEVKEVVEPVQKLCDNHGFWQYQSDGLAVFRSPALFRYYRLPIRLEELLVVAERFYVKPLFRLFMEDERFYLLALSKKEVRLLECTRYGVREVELPEGTPRSLQEVLQLAGVERQIQVHSAGTAVLFHGHGARAEDEKQDLREFLRRVDKGVREKLREARAPLVLAGVDYLMALYRDANTYSQLVSDGGVQGNPDGRRPEELQAEAWKVAEPYFRKGRQETASRYIELAGSGRTSNDTRQVVPAACQGRVEHLFVAGDHQQWGSFDPATHRVRISRKKRLGDEDLLDLAALQTFLQGGSVYTVPPEELPGGKLLAAVFRY